MSAAWKHQVWLPPSLVSRSTIAMRADGRRSSSARLDKTEASPPPTNTTSKSAACSSGSPMVGHTLYKVRGAGNPRTPIGAFSWIRTRHAALVRTCKLPLGAQARGRHPWQFDSDGELRRSHLERALGGRSLPCKLIFEGLLLACLVVACSPQPRHAAEP